MLKFNTDNVKLNFAANEVMKELPDAYSLIGDYDVKKIDCGLSIDKTEKGGVIGYSDIRSFTRAISILSEKRTTPVFSVYEQPKYTILGAMPDAARNAVPTVDTLKKFCRIIALEGYNTLLLYMEDVFELEKYPYFGHLRGRYTKEELKELDEYAEKLGIELVPAIQTLAHLNGMFEWPASYNIIDCNDIMLVGEEKTYELIEEMIKTCAKTFKTRKINIGLDEARMLGSGRYLDKNGYKYRPEIMAEHMPKVKDICLKYGFKPSMWSDMFFRMLNNGVYRVKGTEVPQKIVDSVPPELTLVYWDYSQPDVESYDEMFRQHKAFKNPIAFAGGVSSWYGLIPLTVHSKGCALSATESICKNNIDEVYVTMWGDDGSACSLFSPILPLFIYGEACWSEHDTREARASKRIEVCTGLNEEILLDLERVHDMPTRTEFGIKSNNPSKYMLYNNILTGKFDAHTPDGTAEHCAKMAQCLRDKKNSTGEYGYIFDSVIDLCEVLALKSELGKVLCNAYKSNDKNKVKEICEITIPLVITAVNKFKNTLRIQWFKENKTFGFDVLDIRLGGLVSQLESAKIILNEWLEGKREKVDELEAQRLEYLGSDHKSYDGTLIELNRWERMAAQDISNMVGYL